MTKRKYQQLTYTMKSHDEWEDSPQYDMHCIDWLYAPHPGSLRCYMNHCVGDDLVDGEEYVTPYDSIQGLIFTTRKNGKEWWEAEDSEFRKDNEFRVVIK